MSSAAICKQARIISEEMAVEKLTAAVKAVGGVRAYARKWDLAPTTISLCINGRMKPSNNVLAGTNVSKLTNYWELPE